MEITINFGGMANPIREQLEHQGVELDDKTYDKYDKLAFSATMLNLHGY